MSATKCRATTRALEIKAASNAMNARYMSLEISSAQRCLVNATREDSTEITTSYNTNNKPTGPPPVCEILALQESH
jgi:hypothetical protein